MRLIDNWREAHRLWSVRLAALGALLMAALLGFPDMWADLPADMRALVPARLQALVPMLLFAATIASRVMRQPGAVVSAPAPAAALGLLGAGPGYDREQLIRELIRDEGERLTVYRCTAGKRTIGVGRNLDDVGISHAEATQLGITTSTAIASGISRTQSRSLLNNDIARCERDLDAHLSWWRQLDPVRQRVLLNMCFNLGISSLLGFRNTLAAIRAGRYAAAVLGMQASAWHGQVGARARRLEAMMANGA